MVERTARLRALNNQIRRVGRSIERLEHRHRRFSWYRLAVFFGALAMAFAIGFARNGAWGVTVLVVGLGVFALLAQVHRRLENTLARHRAWRRIKLCHRSRALLDWSGIPAGAFEPVPSGHPFALDLDLVGARSALQLLNACASADGSARLQTWLTTETPDYEKSQDRQRLVRELAPLSRFRDKLLLTLSLGARERLHGHKLARWLSSSAPSESFSRRLAEACAFVFVNYLLVIGAVTGVLGRPYWEVSVAAYFLFHLRWGQGARSILNDVSALEDQLASLARVLLFLEKYPAGRSPALRELCALFRDRATRASRQVRRMRVLSSLAGLRMNAVIGLALNLALPWDFAVAWLVDRQRRRLAELVPAWLDRCAEIEALVSLACFAHLNPDYAFPELIVGGEEEGGRLEATALGHPLIPFEDRVTNEFALAEGRIVILTGSNMSGKSTFIKTLGVNLALAMAGGPVAARRLRVTPFRIFTCINVSDSVHDHISTFYAEVRRLKRLLDALERPGAFPLFYLIDEIFRGTNNRERLAGSGAYLRALTGKRGAGVITTHDLELAWLGETLSGVSNLHFREDIAGDRMVFDYRLRPGVCPTTNALKIMRMEGLPVSLPRDDDGTAAPPPAGRR
jgi:ABC-type multidrug transport system fused ATPase/permease subunit